MDIDDRGVDEFGRESKCDARERRKGFEDGVTGADRFGIVGE